MDNQKLDPVIKALDEIENHLTECWGKGDPGRQPSYHVLLKLRGVIRMLRAIAAGEVA